jgi:peptide/nickel transport system permease protein
VSFLRRLAFAPIVLLVVGAVTYGVPRILRPDLYPGEAFLPGLWHDLDRAFLHLDFGCAGILPGCPPIHDLWVEGMAWDLWLLGGGVVLGTAGGILGGVWCARRPRSLGTRMLETAAMVAYCAPVFFVGLFVLWMFNPIYGRIPLPAFFDAEPRWVNPWYAPWDWFRQLLVPWIVLAAPLGAMCLRLTLAETRDHQHGARRADAVGARVLQVHVAGGRAREPGPRPGPGLPLLCALGLWATVLLIAMGLFADGIVARFDPRVRTSPARAW